MKQTSLFDSEPSDLTLYPEWYSPSKYRKKANSNVIQKMHPMGLLLSISKDHRCGNCEFITSSMYPKCEKSNRTSGPATDIVKKWQGCELWSSAEIADIERGSFRRAVQYWMNYYISMETIDRAVPHRPPVEKRRNGVILFESRLSKSRFRDEIIRVRNKLEDLLCGIPSSVRNEARDIAAREHEQKLKPCTCTSCISHREQQP